MIIRRLLFPPDPVDGGALPTGEHQLIDEPILKDIPADAITGDEPEVAETPAIEETPADETPTEIVEEAPVKDDKKADIDFDAFSKEMGLDDLPAAKAVAKPDVAKPVTQQPGEAFDYTLYTPNEQQLLKRMAVPARQWAVSMLNERRTLNAKTKELEATVTTLKSGQPQIPGSYYENPEGYKLTPQFAELQENTNLASAIYQHWRKQKVRAEAGEDWQDLDIDPKSGRLVVSEKKQVTSEAKVDIGEHLEHSREQVLRYQNKAEQMAQQHKSKVGETTTFIKQQEDSYFPQFKDENFVGWKLANNVTEALKKAGLGDNPLASMLAKAAAANTLLVNYVKHLKQGKTTTTKLAEDRKAAGPGGVKTAEASNGKGNKPLLTVDDFQKEMHTIQ